MSLKKFIPILLCALVVGCGSAATKPHRSPHAVVSEHWNAARAGVLASLASEQYKNGHLDDARHTIDTAVALNNKNVSLHILSAKIAMEQGQLDLAEKELRLAQLQDGSNAEADYLCGVVYERWQKPQEAFELYQSAARKDQNELAYVLASADMLVATGSSKDAIALLTAKLDSFEHSALLRAAIGQLLAGTGQYAEAINYLREASLLATDDFSIKEHLALALYFAKQYQDSADLLVRLVADDKYKTRVDLYLALGSCYEQTGKLTDAKSAFETATQISPGTPAAWVGLAKVAMEKNDFRRAEMALRKANSLDPASGETQLLLGYVRLRQNRVADAMPYFQKASALDQADPVSLCMIGYAYEKAGKNDQAIQCYAKALKLHPGDELATKLMASVDVRE